MTSESGELHIQCHLLVPINPCRRWQAPLSRGLMETASTRVGGDVPLYAARLGLAHGARGIDMTGIVSDGTERLAVPGWRLRHEATR